MVAKNERSRRRFKQSGEESQDRDSEENDSVKTKQHQNDESWSFQKLLFSYNFHPFHSLSPLPLRLARFVIILFRFYTLIFLISTCADDIFMKNHIFHVFSSLSLRSRKNWIWNFLSPTCFALLFAGLISHFQFFLSLLNGFTRFLNFWSDFSHRLTLLLLLFAICSHHYIFFSVFVFL